MNITRFIESQIASWTDFACRYHGLANCRTRFIDTSTRQFTIQHNPLRTGSTSAATDAASIAARPCFLCQKARPAEQQSMNIRDYEILVNPYPIFPRHLTIAAITHTPQRIAGRIAGMLQLCDMLNGFTIFYNGPRCGASAPDHMHFQAAPSVFFPIWQAIDEASPIATIGNSAVYDILPACLSTKNATESDILHILGSLPPDIETGEPMVNILARTDAHGCHHVVIIPRMTHRPDCYGTEAGQRMISPASIDLAGVIITPRAYDYENLTAAEAVSIISEVTYTAERLITELTS